MVYLPNTKFIGEITNELAIDICECAIINNKDVNTCSKYYFKKHDISVSALTKKKDNHIIIEDHAGKVISSFFDSVSGSCKRVI